ncbi:MAG: pyridoxal phosphate-dependent aminotransferase [Myxococcales bacterium]|nr:pyridoxal phosphate-dependent aminotransferase [Myxococcales bacterium]
MSEGFTAFRPVPRTGVIYVTTEAQKMGFRFGAPGWCNLGQGQPETGSLVGAPPRVESLPIDLDDQEYAPVPGLWELREAVAGMYNELFRKGLSSKYSAENVSISGGGRVSLLRAAASLGAINLGHFLPDYTAYEELLDVFRLFSPIPILLEPERGYDFPPAQLEREIVGRGLGAILLSNPCNPTGRLVGGEALDGWVRVLRDNDCALLVDEFYSHYLWQPSDDPAPMESAARYVDNVDHDPVLIFDGLTKNWRYPGWRITWTVGPKSVIEGVASAGSFLDGGGSKPMQRAACEVVSAAHARAETAAIHSVFGRKREKMLSGLKALGLQVDRDPEGGFYVWGSVRALPAPLNTGMGFFRAALERQVITVPGEFFDVNPGKRRGNKPSRFRDHVRFSFGPEERVLDEALGRLAAMVDARR